MPKAKPVVSLSGLVDSDMEEDALNMDAFPAQESNQENDSSAKKRGRPAKAPAKKIANTRATGRRTTGDPIAPKKAPPKKKANAKRVPLKEQTNVQQAEDTEEVDEFTGERDDNMEVDELVETRQLAKRKAPAKRAGKQSKKKTEERTNVVAEQPDEQPKAMEKDGEFEYTPTAKGQTKRQGRAGAQKAKAHVRQISVEPRRQERVIPETQVAMEIDQSEPLEEDVEEEDGDAVPQSVFRRINNARDNPRRHQPLVARRRAGSASDNERGGNDPAMRRKLGEMTTKFEKLDMKYRTLREEGIKEANANFEKYKTQSQANAKGRDYNLDSLYCYADFSPAANDLIVSLKKELATQKALSKDSASLENEIITRDADLTRTQALADQLSTSLSEVQNENKALQAKLANSRSASTAVESLGTKTPGSAMRGKTPAQRTIMVGSAEAAYAAQVAQLKEDLYSDLTGLILRGVERKEDSDVYDCIQTGRNGSK